MRIRPLVLVLLLVSSPLAAAQAPAAGGPVPDARVEAAPRVAERTHHDPLVLERHCLRETGTRIRLRGERRACAPFAGRVWTRDDLDRTGDVDVASALRRLDVSIR